MIDRMELFKSMYPEHLHNDPMAWHNFKFYVYPTIQEMIGIIQDVAGEWLIESKLYGDRYKQHPRYKEFIWLDTSLRDITGMSYGELAVKGKK